MSVKITFQGPPTRQKNATLYQHAQQAMKLVRDARDQMAAYDNKDKVDINSTPGTVVVPTGQSISMSDHLAGALSKRNYTSISGQMVDGKLEARLTDNGYGKAQVTFQEDDKQAVYTVETSPGGHYQYHPGTLKVIQDKTSGAIELEQQADFPWKLTFASGAVETERTFGPNGPTEVEDARLFKTGEQLKATIDGEIEALRKLDNGPSDFDPQAGKVVVAGFGTTNSDNLVYGHMAGDYPIPTEASLTLSPETGQVQSYTRGFGDHNVLSYHRDGDVEVYQREQFLACNRMEVRPDGSRLVQGFHQAHLGKVDPQLFRQESKVTTRLLPRILDLGHAGRTLTHAGLAGTTAGVLTSLLTSASPSLAIGVGLLAAAGAAAATSSVALRGVDVNDGVTRFEGPNPMANAHQAYENLDMGYYKRTTLWDSEQGPTREDCIEFFNRTETGYGGGLAILSDKLGEKGEPALVMVPKDFHYPVRLEENGLWLPGDVRVPYSSIRGVSEWR
ncbi:hypothetical protein IV102_23260 [bacterium]|nr:hypothetical protein [bacterium]